MKLDEVMVVHLHHDVSFRHSLFEQSFVTQRLFEQLLHGIDSFRVLLLHKVHLAKTPFSNFLENLEVLKLRQSSPVFLIRLDTIQTIAHWFSK